MTKLLFACISLQFALVGATAQRAETNSVGRTMMDGFLKREATRLDGRFLEGISNRQRWEERRLELRQEYLEMLGLWPLPERTPLQARITGIIDRPEGFRVEKLHFQSRPGLYVTGNLYLPRNARPGDKLPAVLYVCGHSGRGRDGNKAAFQHHGMWFATHGYACLIIDTLQLGEIGAIHHGTYRHDRWWWQARGYTPAGVECWNGIRALDYLQSRPEVDGEKIAVTGISGGGAATFWIAAADDRVKVAVPVSGMGDLIDYVGEKVVNGHCDCMFLVNTFQWPWAQIAALVAPRPLLFANSGHDTIFPMPGNERIRGRLEWLYGLYTNRTDRLFDIAVTPGGHEDNPELRLMAYRWINRFLKNDNGPVTEPDLPKIDGKDLRVFPDELPSGELNTKIDEFFVPLATNAIPRNSGEFRNWQREKLAELNRIVFREVLERVPLNAELQPEPGDPATGVLSTESGISIRWRSFHGTDRKSEYGWMVVLEEDAALAAKPDWLTNIAGDDPVLMVSPRGSGPTRWADPAPFYVRRSLPLLGRTLDGDRVLDVLSAVAAASKKNPTGITTWRLVGRGQAAVIAAYAVLLDSRVSAVTVVEPAISHREGPIFLNVLRVVDVPEAFALLAPRSLSVFTSHPAAFESLQATYRMAGGDLQVAPLR